MAQKSFRILLIAVLAALMALVWLNEGAPSVFSSALAFPLEPLGAGLRTLSLAGNLGNGLAFALYAALSLFPALLALRHKSERAFRGENIALCCISAFLFFALFGMANPSWLLSAFPYMEGDFLPVAKGIVGGALWSFLILWLVLRLVRMFQTGDTQALLRYLRAVLYALCLLFDAAIALSCASALRDSLSASRQGMDGVMAVLRFLASALPYGLDIFVTLSLFPLFNAFLAGNEEDTAQHAGSLSRRCCLALCAVAAALAAFNGIQLLFSRFLTSVSVHVDIPIVSLAFLLLILLLSRLIVENRRLRSDNDLFI